jgi:hypothetical protein
LQPSLLYELPVYFLEFEINPVTLVTWIAEIPSYPNWVNDGN